MATKSLRFVQILIIALDRTFYGVLLRTMQQHQLGNKTAGRPSES